MREWSEPTSLEFQWRERLTVPVYAYDDMSVGTSIPGQCIWIPRKIQRLRDHLFYTAEWDTYMYKNSYSWELRGLVQKGDIVVSSGPPTLVGGEYMIPLEGGGAVQRKWMRPSSPPELGINPNIYVVDIGIPKHICRFKMYKAATLFLTFCLVFLSSDEGIESPEVKKEQPATRRMAKRVEREQLIKPHIDSASGVAGRVSSEARDESHCNGVAKWVRWEKTRDEVFGKGVEPWGECWAVDLIFGGDSASRQSYIFQKLLKGRHHQNGVGTLAIPGEWKNDCVQNVVATSRRSAI